MTKPEPQASLVILRAIVASAKPEQVRRLLDDIRRAEKDAA